LCFLVRVFKLIVDRVNLVFFVWLCLVFVLSVPMQVITYKDLSPK